MRGLVWLSLVLVSLGFTLYSDWLPASAEINVLRRAIGDGILVGFMLWCAILAIAKRVTHTTDKTYLQRVATFIFYIATLEGYLSHHGPAPAFTALASIMATHSICSSLLWAGFDASLMKDRVRFMHRASKICWTITGVLTFYWIGSASISQQYRPTIGDCISVTLILLCWGVGVTLILLANKYDPDASIRATS